ncbi:MAG: V-type ATP synthase subunit I [Pseudomonadota bacterium]
MSIAPLKRVAVIGAAKDKQALLQGLQALGCLHLTPLQSPDSANALGNKEVEPPTNAPIAEARKALKFLNDCPIQRRHVVRQEGFRFDESVAQALEVKTKLRVANDKCDYLRARIKDVEPWGNIDFSDEGAPAGHHFWFYVLPRHKTDALNAVSLPWCVVAVDTRFAYLVIVAREEPAPDALPVPRVHLGSQSLKTLREELRDTEIHLDELAAERGALTRFSGLIEANLTAAENQAELNRGEKASYRDDALVALQGWAPVDQLDDIEGFARAKGLAVHSQEPGFDDAPPTLLEQPDSRQSGVDLSLFYQVPRYGSWDPTLLLLISFPLFFAMIMADAGYGIVLGALLVLFWRRLGASVRGRSYRLLGAWLVFATCLYGVLVGSYFGTSPPDGSPLAALNILSINDFDTMMRLSIGVGVLHIIIANLLSAYVHRSAPDMLSKFGWIIISISGYLLYSLGSSDLVQQFAPPALCVGVALVFFFSSEAKGVSLKTQFKRILDGAQALAGAMTAFGDVLSYMRLFALGLASASLAVTFNQLAMSAYDALPGLGFLAAALILLLGHGLNLALAIISGVVHGLRLNYIEFFKWGFDDEGEAFSPFSLKRVEAT